MTTTTQHPAGASRPKRDPLAASGLVQVNGIVMTKAEADAMRKHRAAAPKAAPKAASNAPKAPPAPAAKVDLAPLAKAVADQAALTGEAPAIGIKAASHPAAASPAAPATDHAVIRVSWDETRAEMLAATGRA